jgi:hypothetical protein
MMKMENEPKSERSEPACDPAYNKHNNFNFQERYLDALIRAAGVGHKVHDEIDEAIKKLKELAHA